VVALDEEDRAVAKIESALISVSDKTGLPAFAQRLARLGIRIISAGGTARLLRENGVPYEDVADYTGLPELLDGRIKTLHHKILAGLLALRDLEEHRRQLAQHGIRPIDMVVVNLYPIGQVISERAMEPMQAMESIDIGGPTLIRAAAKNYTHVAVVTSPDSYDRVAAELEARGGSLSEETHFALSLQAFRHTAHYDQVIVEYLAGIHGDEPGQGSRF
jgi:phosphoribosylaminoimidazolecarboxamide formyltransferase/IMP cyclohydrolase